MHSSLTNMSLRRKANFLVCRAFVSIFIKASIAAVASEKLHKNTFLFSNKWFWILLLQGFSNIQHASLCASLFLYKPPQNSVMHTSIINNILTWHLTAGWGKASAAYFHFIIAFLEKGIINDLGSGGGGGGWRNWVVGFRTLYNILIINIVSSILSG